MPESTSDQITNCINTKQSFLVEAGAGSGKTWSLIETLKGILQKEGDTFAKNDQQVACITYTNIAKDEIIARIDNDPVVFVSTIHEFLWHIMKNYQAELREAILEYNSANQRNPVEDLETKIKHKTITYSQYGRDFEKGKITHNDVIEFSSKLFEKYPKISRLVASRYPYIFVDEYQDTEKRTVDLLLERLLPLNTGKLVVGFFGDSMQKIYEQGVGIIRNPQLRVITKEENYRCSVAVIDLLNKIRPDLQQVAAGHNLSGEVSLFYSNNNLSDSQNYTKVFRHLQANGWSPTKTKVLMLTHKGIAGKLDYPKLLAAYDVIPFYRERLLKIDEEFSALFQKLEEIIAAYDAKRYGEFLQLLGKEGFNFSKHEHKKIVIEQLEQLKSLRHSAAVKEVLNRAFDKKVLIKPQRVKDLEIDISASNLSEEMRRKKAFYDALMIVPYQEVVNVSSYIKDQTPFSTKHGVKGAEYEDVLVVIDDSAWNMYNFNDVFGNNQRNQARYQRTLNLLYVCCSRAKNHLALLALSTLDSNALSNLNTWFGRDNIYDVSSIQES